MAEPITIQNINNRNEARYSDEALFGQESQSNPVGSSAGTSGLQPLADTNARGGMFSAFNNSAHSAVNVFTNADNRKTASNTNDTLAQISGLKTNEQWQAAVADGSLSDDALKEKYGRNIDIQKVRDAQQGKQGSTEAYSFNEAMKGVRGNIATMSSQELQSQVTQIATQYNQNPNEVLAKLKGEQDRGRANLSQLQTSGNQLVDNDMKNHTINFNNTADAQLKEGLLKAGIDMQSINNRSYKEGDNERISDYFIELVGNEDIAVDGLNEAMAEIEAATGELPSYIDIATSVEKSAPWLGKDTIHMPSDLKEKLISNILTRSKNRAKYNEVNAVVEQKKQVEMDRVNGLVAAHKREVGKNALLNTYGKDFTKQQWVLLGGKPDGINKLFDTLKTDLVKKGGIKTTTTEPEVEPVVEDDAGITTTGKITKAIDRINKTKLEEFNKSTDPLQVAAAKARAKFKAAKDIDASAAELKRLAKEQAMAEKVAARKDKLRKSPLGI